jgi:DNA (cytosine-5)-methyltransferase 1
LNALNFGLPQKRERIFIVGFREARRFIWPKPALSRTSLTEILEENVSDFYYASEKIQKSRLLKREGKNLIVNRLSGTKIKEEMSALIPIPVPCEQEHPIIIC